MALMQRRKYIAGIILVFFSLGELSSLWGHRVRKSHRVHLPSKWISKEKGIQKEENSWIDEVIITTKKNRDFEYFSTLWHSFCGKSYDPNRIGDDREQCYVLGVDSEFNFAGTYVVILLNESLKNLMGQGTLTLEYMVCGELDPRRITFSLPEKHVADDRQILVRLDPSRQFRKKIVAWQITIKGGQKEYVKSSLFWKKLMRSAVQ
jgi:hypothetical protein